MTIQKNEPLILPRLVLLLVKGDVGEENGIVRAELHTAAPIEGVGRIRLHPFRRHHHSGAVGQGSAAEVAQPRAAIGNGDPFRFAKETHSFRVKFRDEEGRSVAEDVIVVRAAAGVDQIQPSAARDPVLLGAVVAHALAVVEHQGKRLFVEKPVRRAGNVAVPVVAQALIEGAAVGDQRALAKPAGNRNGKGVSHFSQGKGLSVKVALYDGGVKTGVPGVLCLLVILVIDGNEQASVL